VATDRGFFTFVMFIFKKYCNFKYKRIEKKRLKILYNRFAKLNFPKKFLRSFVIKHNILNTIVRERERELENWFQL